MTTSLIRFSYGVARLCTLLLATAIVTAQTNIPVEEIRALPAYGQMVREFRQLWDSADPNRYTPADAEKRGFQLRDLRFRAQKLHFDYSTSSKVDRQIDQKLAAFLQAITAAISQADARATASPKDELGDLLTEAERLANSGSGSLEKSLELLKPHARRNSEIAALVAAMELELDRRAVSAPIEIGENKDTLRYARASMLDKGSFFLAALDPRTMTSKDAIRVLDMTKYMFQAVDDINDPERPYAGKSSTPSKYIKRLTGLAKLADSVSDPEARKIMSGLRDTLGTWDRKIKALDTSTFNPIKAIDVPMDVAAALLENSRKGMDLSISALEDIGKAIGGDSAALTRSMETAVKIEEALSPSAYGNAMAKALRDRFVDRIPLARMLAKWVAPNAGRRETSTTELTSSDTPDVEGTRPEGPLDRVAGVWQFKVNCPPHLEDPKCQGYVVVPGRPFLHNLFSPKPGSTGNERSRLQELKLENGILSGEVIWFWTGDKLRLAVEPDGTMAGTWKHSFKGEVLPAKLVRVHPNVHSARMTRLTGSRIVLDIQGRFLPTDPRIAGYGMVEMFIKGMTITKWEADQDSGGMCVEIDHEPNVRSGSKLIWLNGSPVRWQYQ